MDSERNQFSVGNLSEENTIVNTNKGNVSGIAPIKR